jgi:hypothetical protein
LVYCRECKRNVEDCEHFVEPISSQHGTVFDPKVQSLAYEKTSMILEVEFKNGQVWQLIGIKPEIYDELLHAILVSQIPCASLSSRTGAPAGAATSRNRSDKRGLSRMPATDD